MKNPIVIELMMIVCGGVFGSAQTPTAANTSQVHSVCDVLKDLKEFDGKMVSVRGTLLSGPHGSFITGDCSFRLTVKGFTWPNLIWLTYPRGPDGRRHEIDSAADERVRNAIKGFHLRESDQVLLTYIGILEAKDIITSVTTTRTGQVLGLGFGPDVDAPAQLLVYSAAHPSVVRHKSVAGDK